MTLQQLLIKIGVVIDGQREAQLLQFLDELLRWNRSINLTAITNRDEALEKHLVDALTLLPLLQGDERLLDMGSGGGLPGLPLKIARPTLKLTSVDAAVKKITFQRHAIRMLGLQDVVALHGRLEVLAQQDDLKDSFQVVVARAFADLVECARLARPFLAIGGRLIAMKGPEGGAELESGRPALAALGLQVIAVHRIKLPRSDAERLLIELLRGPVPGSEAG